ncbi:carboxypeptidase-like regulatory domain-containing protein [Roseimaritima ulvae]|uniref:carboxypeptidase-like regulatory domain-containing protein n=1 Tax=Roseimaritima ulvae TaxID=980254 RepID=UPI001EE4CE2A|nr:carboxypeptidase-like regulatory domain-containing protein [Roseimaritima ulvae]
MSGTVTVDGSPIEGAVVTFQPTGGRPSVGTTDASGQYTLRYSASIDGALIGAHKVVITTERATSGGEGSEPLVEGRKEILPAKYNEATELTAQVEAGSNTIDFDLQSS